MNGVVFLVNEDVVRRGRGHWKEVRDQRSRFILPEFQLNLKF